MEINANKFWVFFYLVNLISCSIDICGTYISEGTGTCTQYSTNETYCCYLRTYSNNFWSSMCYPINATDYLQLNGILRLGKYKYFVDCGESTGTTCGTLSNPVSYKDCSQFSRNTNTCCFVKYKNDTSCVWLGSGYNGDITYNGIELVCNSVFIGVLKYLLVIFVIFIY